MSLFNIFFTFLKIGTFNYGGGLAILSLIENEIVTKSSYLTSSQFIDIVTISQMTPGPIAINAATFSGYLVYGISGSIVATFGLIIVPFLLIVCLAGFFEKVKDLPTTKAIFKGIRPVVVGLILNAAYIISEGSLTSIFSFVVLIGVLVAILKFKVSPIVCIFSAGAFGGIAGTLLDFLGYPLL